MNTVDVANFFDDVNCGKYGTRTRYILVCEARV